MRITSHQKSFAIEDFDAPPPGQRVQCKQIFASLRYGVKIFNVTDSGAFSGEQRWMPAEYQPFEVHGLVERALRFWQQSGHYKESDIQNLRELDKSLPPIRTHYIEIRYKEETATVRIFDGSENVQMGPIPWFRVPGGEAARSPIERLYNYRFPERDQSPSPFIVELGLLGNPKTFINGVDAIFHSVAQFIDSTYNNGNYLAFRDLSLIASRNLQVYGSARPQLVDHYRPFGYEPVLQKGPTGAMEPVVFKNGMHLLKVSGVDFLKRHMDKKLFPSIDGKEDAYLLGPIDRQRQLENREVELRPPLDIRSMEEFWQAWDHIVNYYSHYYINSAPGSPTGNRAYYMLVQDLYHLYKSPIYWNSSHPVVAHMKLALLKQFLSMEPKNGWFMLNVHVIQMERVLRNPESLDWVELEEYKFEKD
ncbi:MAG: hypothetical protein KDD33_05995 [Bdellovibrionales bacterium]|nr:hypothetical protein [Bdellovibrionales bacterium]